MVKDKLNLSNIFFYYHYGVQVKFNLIFQQKIKVNHSIKFYNFEQI